MVLVWGVSLCCSLTAPLPPDAHPIEPPAIFARWWAMTEGCSGRTGALAAVRWYRAPGSSVPIDGVQAAGYWSSRYNRIVLPEEMVDNGLVVRHEMLHALARNDTHSRADFLDACASVVDCRGGCVDDGGPWNAPQRDYLVLPPDSLDIASEARVLPPESDGQRWVTLLVTVRNSRDRAMVVKAPGDPAAPPTFAFDIRGPTGGISVADVARDSSTLFFRPHETKSRLFEFRVSSELTRYHVPTGQLLVRGAYARRWAAWDTVLVSP
ncbi:MAG: hypothetical protein LH467_02525 [Gemmatimonadaceae bacterium]|nr:hypothetical protein [Gemmatimonadaceae bacterium]